MRKTVVAAAGLTAAGAALLATGWTGPAAAAPSGPAATARTIRVTAQLLVGEELDLGAPGRSVGDQLVFSGSLFSVTNPDRRVGRIGGYCVLDDLDRNAGQCTMTATLRGGQITVQGEQEALPTPRTVANAVTGGTGEFRRVRGQMIQEFVTPPIRDLTFELTLH